jgi:capsular polysaccharide biosynthesis protein
VDRQITGTVANVPPMSLGRIALSHWVTVMVAVVIGGIVGVAAGFALTPTYTAGAGLVVGKSLNLTNTAAISGLPLAEAQLAEDYSRLAATPTVNQDVTKILGYQPSGTLSASPLADSPVIAVYGTGSSRTAAIALANAGARAMISAINTVNQQTDHANQALLAQYQADSVAQVGDQQAITVLEGQINAAHAAAGLETGAAQSATQTLAESLNFQLIKKQAILQTENLKINALQNQYEAAFDPNLAIEQAVTPLGGASIQSDNRLSNIEIGGIAGVVVGAVVGLALAAILENRVKVRKIRVDNEAQQAG